MKFYPVMINRIFNLLNIDPENLLKGQNRLLLQGSAAALMLKGMGLALGYLLTLTLAGKGGADVLGSFVLSAILLDIISIISSLGTENGMLALVSRFDSTEKQHLIAEVVLKIYLLVVPAGILLTIAVYFSAGFLIPLFSGSQQLLNYIKIMIFGILPLTLLKINSQYMRGRKKIVFFGLFNYVLVYLSVLIFLVYAGLSVSGKSNMLTQAGIDFSGFVPYAFTAGCTFIFILSLGVMIKDLFRGKFTAGSDEASFGQILSLSIPVMYSEILMFAKTWTASLLIGYYLSETDVGIFNIILKLSSVSSIIVMAVSAITMPLFSQYFAGGDFRGIYKLLKRSGRLIYLTAFPVIAIIMMAGNLVLGIIDETFTAGYIPLLFLCLGQAAEILSGTGAYLLQVTGRQKLYRNLVIINTVLSIALFYMLIPIWGLSGGAIAMMAGSIIWSSSLIFFINMDMKKYR